MPFDSKKHHRRSIRMPKYDYSQPGSYFVTICTQYRRCIYGEITAGAMQLNAAGRVVTQWWMESAKKFPLLELDEFIVMPNHFHGIAKILDAEDTRPSLDQ